MKNKVLIIGQALPATKQNHPYDTTMLYDWLLELGISKNQAQYIFEFDAVYGRFPGFDKKGGHLKPTNKQMEEYWIDVLNAKVIDAKSILVFGRVAEHFLKTKQINKPVAYTIHPSKRNYSLFQNKKNEVLGQIKKILS